MTVGFNSTASGIHFAVVDETAGPKVICVGKVPYDLATPAGNEILFEAMDTLIKDLRNKHGNPKTACLRSSSGMRGSSADTIRAEAILELVIVRSKLDYKRITPQSLPKALQCPKGTDWRKQITVIANTPAQFQYWAAGTNGSAAAAFASNA